MERDDFLTAFERRLVKKGIRIERREYRDDMVFGHWRYVFAFSEDWYGQYPLSEIAIRGAAAEGVTDENAIKFAEALADHAYERCWNEIASKIVAEMPQ